jgi:hypothetical protein
LGAVLAELTECGASDELEWPPDREGGEGVMSPSPAMRGRLVRYVTER